MSTLAKIAGAILIAAAAGAGGYFYGANHGATKPEQESAASTQPAEEDKPVVEVETIPLKRGTIAETITCYGTVIAQPGDVRTISVPFESRVKRMLVSAGESIAAGSDVAEVEASPDALLALQDARNGVDAATRDLQQTKQRFIEHLATNQELSQAQATLTSAQLKLDNLVKRGVGQSQKLKSTSAGIVMKLDAQEGQIVPAGGGIVEIASGNRVEVRLGVEPGDLEAVKPGMTISLSRVNRSDEKPIEGKVRMIEHRIDPATHLVPVLVTLPNDAHLLLDSFIVGKFERTAENAMIVPRDAALPDDDGTFAVFTVRDEKAVKQKVKIGLQTDEQSQIISDDLKADEPIVVVGNYQLSDGMAVEVKKPATQPSEEKASKTVAEGKS